MQSHCLLCPHLITQNAMHHHRAAAITGNFEAKLMASEEQRIVALLGRFREGSHLTQSSWLVAEEAYAESMSHIAEEEQACRLVEPGRVSRRGGHGHLNCLLGWPKWWCTSAPQCLCFTILWQALHTSTSLEHQDSAKAHEKLIMAPCFVF